MLSLNQNSRIVALDVGAKRIGVASAGIIARLASPLTTLIVTGTVFEDISNILAQETAALLVVGLPRGLDSQETEQTKTVRAFVADLKKQLTIPVVWQDEALTSVKSEEELRSKKSSYKREDIDALAATYILEDYLSNNAEDEI
jgi:putative Holliday junction resolvase